VGLNEAQLINPQGINKNMATRDKYTRLIDEWLNGGRVIYNQGVIIAIEKDKEFLIKHNSIILHLTIDRVMLVIGSKRYTSTIPLRGRPRRGRAIKAAKVIMFKLPPDVVETIQSRLPWILTLVARV
jgi:hypothetical protein